MNNRARYVRSQLLAIPLVAIPTLVGAFLIGGVVANALQIHNSDISGLVVFGIACLMSAILTRLVGQVLERIQMLPPGAAKRYPFGRSWEQYADLGMRVSHQDTKKPNKA